MNSHFQGYEKINIPGRLQFFLLLVLTVRQNSLQSYKQLDKSFEQDFTTLQQHQNNHSDLSNDNEFSVKSEEQEEDVSIEA